MRPLRKCVISPRMTKTEGLNNSYNDDEWYDEFYHGNFAFDDASPLAAELQATPWPYHTSHLSFLCMMDTQTRSGF
jgi:hypothetical protein